MACRSENYLLNKDSNLTAAQLGLQPIPVGKAQAQTSGEAASESYAAPAPGPAPLLPATTAAAVIAANLTASGATSNPSNPMQAQYQRHLQPKQHQFLSLRIATQDLSDRSKKASLVRLVHCYLEVQTWEGQSISSSLHCLLQCPAAVVRETRGRSIFVCCSALGCAGGCAGNLAGAVCLLSHSLGPVRRQQRLPRLPAWDLH